VKFTLKRQPLFVIARHDSAEAISGVLLVIETAMPEAK